MTVKVMSDEFLVNVYLMRRVVCFFDEWLFYSALLFLLSGSFSYVIVGGVLVYGTLAILTSYRNLKSIEIVLGLPPQEIFWPVG